MEYIIIAIVVAGISFWAGGIYFRQDPPTLAPPKPFGLAAFEAHGLGVASDDALRVGVAIISFLGHPFTVVSEAKGAMSRAYEREAEDRRDVAENLKEIARLQEQNGGLSADAVKALARAKQLGDLIDQVNMISGS